MFDVVVYLCNDVELYLTHGSFAFFYILFLKFIKSFIFQRSIFICYVSDARTGA